MSENLLAMLDDIDDKELKRMEALMNIRNTRLVFALDHHLTTRGDRMDFKHHPHIRSLYESVSPYIVLQGSVQCMKSEWAIVDHLASAYMGLSVFFVVPKFESRTTFVQNRVNRPAAEVEEYKKIIGAGFFDSVSLKSFGKGVIKYVGSNVLSDFKEFPADIIFVDELDECNQENVGYGLDRLRASPYQFKRYIGNPRQARRGINAEFEKSDKREWYVPCQFCGRYSELNWFSTIVDAIMDTKGTVVDYTLLDTEWEEGCGRDLYALCQAGTKRICQGVLERASNKGRWKAHNPDSSIEGYHISMMCSLINTLSGMWQYFREAVNDPIKMQQFFNSYLGLPFSAVGSKVTSIVLDQCIDPEHELKIFSDHACVEDDSHSGPCSMGIDVGRNFDVRISVLENNRRRMVYVGKFRTDPNELYDLAIRYNVETAVIDFGPETHLVQEIQDNIACDMWLCRYSGEGKEKKEKHDLNDRIVSIDRTQALDRSYSQLLKKRNILPRNYQDILLGQYVAEMCSSVRHITQDNRGNNRYEWTKAEDHAFHADAYDMLASAMMMDVVLDEVYVN